MKFRYWCQEKLESLTTSLDQSEIWLNGDVFKKDKSVLLHYYLLDEPNCPMQNHIVQVFMFTEKGDFIDCIVGHNKSYLDIHIEFSTLFRSYTTASYALIYETNVNKWHRPRCQIIRKE